MKSAYLYERKSEVADSVLVQLLSQKSGVVGPLFQEVPVEPFQGLVQFVESPDQADYMMLPHTYFQAARISGYVEGAETFAKEHNLQTIIFTTSDYHHSINFWNSIVLRTASYRSALLPQERVMPAFVEDLGTLWGVEYREKPDVPKICFHGKVGNDSWLVEVKYQLRIMWSRVLTLLGKLGSYEWQGLYYRRKSLKYLRKTNFNLDLGERKFFSAARSTIKADPAVVRKEFVDGIKNADLPLVVRGNGNFSLRFFEVLSLGRVPLFIDTNTPLPLEGEINYDEFMLRVDHTKLHKLPKIIAEFWENTTPEQYLAMQKKAREVFESKLWVGSYFKHFFNQLPERSK